MRIIIMGCGALGSWTTMNLVADNRGDLSISVLDFDRIEERNLRGTQFYYPEQEGLLKSEALQYNIYKLLQKEIAIFSYKLTDFNVKTIIKDYDLIIDTFDNFDARRTITEACKDIVECLHIGFSKDMTFAIEWNENYKIPSDITSDFDVCTMSSASAFVKFVASIGALTAEEFIFNGKRWEFVGNKFSIREIN